MVDAEAGKRLFKEHCAFCHTVHKDGRDKFGPNLYGLFGRTVGSKPGFRFSPEYKNADFVWNEENLLEYLNDADKFVKLPVPHAGIPDEQERKNLIAYLKDVTSSTT